MSIGRICASTSVIVRRGARWLKSGVASMPHGLPNRSTRGKSHAEPRNARADCAHTEGRRLDRDARQHRPRTWCHPIRRNGNRSGAQVPSGSSRQRCRVHLRGWIRWAHDTFFGRLGRSSSVASPSVSADHFWGVGPRQIHLMHSTRTRTARATRAHRARLTSSVPPVAQCVASAA